MLACARQLNMLFTGVMIADVDFIHRAAVTKNIRRRRTHRLLRRAASHRRHKPNDQDEDESDAAYRAELLPPFGFARYDHARVVQRHLAFKRLSFLVCHWLESRARASATGSDRKRDSQLQPARQNNRARSLIGSSLRRLVTDLVALNFGHRTNMPASSTNVAALFASADFRNVSTPAAHDQSVSTATKAQKKSHASTLKDPIPSDKGQSIQW